MDYKIKYHDALEGIRELYNSDCDMIRVKRLRRRLEHIFPELAESENEKIREALKQGFFEYGNSFTTFGGIQVGDILAWLEKQGKQNPVKWSEEDEKMIQRLKSCVYAADITSEGRKELIAWLEKQGKQNPVKWSEEDEKIKESIKKVLANTNFNKLDIKYSFYEMISWLEKQREQAKFEPNLVWSEEDEEMLKWLCHIIHLQRLDRAITLKEESELGEWIDKWLNYNPQTKQSEQLTDKIKPRFKEGDWIIDGRITCKVLGVTGKSYDLHLHNDDYCHFETDIQTVDQYYRLWTIEDAKDGDVLVDEDNNIGIYVGKNDDFWHSCIYLGCDNYLHGINVGAYHKHKNTKPATKEQRNLLFQKIKEEGYEWDAQKKEVKKHIDGVEPRFKEGDFIMNNDITEDGKPEIFKIIKVCSSWYDVENVYDGRQTMITFSQDYTCHLWTIDDAKQGDILMVDDEFIVVLYRKMTDGTECKDTSILTEYEYDINDNTFTKGSHLFYCDICPATYTQREVLTNYIQQVLNWEK